MNNEFRTELSPAILAAQKCKLTPKTLTLQGESETITIDLGMLTNYSNGNQNDLKSI